MSSAIREWLNLGVRWFHVFAGIMWVGQTYYFTWLDGQFGKLEKNAAGGALPSSVWMVHSGGFYAVEKKKSLGVGPEQVQLVSLGSADDLAEWNGAAVSCVLPEWRAHRHRRRGYFSRDRGSRLDWLCWPADGSSTTLRCGRVWASPKPCLPGLLSL